MNVLFFQKTQGNYFPSEFFAEIKKLPKFALCLEQFSTNISILLLKRSRITTSEKLRAMYIHNWVVPILAQTYSIVYEVCGEPESVGEACAFSFIRCWCSLAKTRKAILQNNILIQTLMKHYLHHSFRALFLFLAVLLSLPMLAVEVEIDGINYELNSETKQATVIAKSSGKYSGNIVVPKSIEFRDTANVSVTNFSVTSIGERAFYACGALSSVAIGNGVTSIGNDAFFGCSNLTSVTIGNVVRSIGSKAFYECASLTSITIPKSVVSIGDEAFYACNGLSSVHISDIAAWCKIEFGELANPLFNANHLYMNGEEIKELVIPDNVTSIGNQAFFYCKGLISVTIPNSVTNIG